MNKCDSLEESRNRGKGFTLMELLVVIAIISMLAAMIFPNLGKVRIRARRAKAIAELKVIELALMDYYTEYSGFPTNNLAADSDNGIYRLSGEGYLDIPLIDAFDRDIIYTYYSSDDYNGSGPGKDFADSCIVFSVGPDQSNNGYTNFGAAYDNAYPPAPAIEPNSDNIYLIVDPKGKEGDIRYKK